MKIKSDFILQEVAGNHVVIPTSDALVDFNGMITLNPVAVFLWKHLESETTAEKLLQAVLAHYDVEEAVAKRDIGIFLQTLQQYHLLENLNGLEF